MESVVGEQRGLNVGSSNFLGLPEPCPWDSDDELLGVGGIKPKSSPIPRRRSSLSCSDDEFQPPPSSSRRVSFADAFGLSLVSVKQFNTRLLCDPIDQLDVDFKDAYSLKLLFALPPTPEEMFNRVQEQKVNLENMELLPGTTTLKGTVRVLNMCFDKLVYIRTSLDCWSSHFDLLAEYMPESSQGVMDCFSFKLTLVPPFEDKGARVDFCIRYETPLGEFWDNNSGQNYVLYCHEKAREQDENEKLKPKSCLKTSRHSSLTSITSDTEEIAEIILNCGIDTVTEPVGLKEETIQEHHVNLEQEENKRNCGRRSTRRAGRMAKAQQYFAQRDETDLQQTEKDTDEVDALVPAIDEAPLNLSTQQTHIASQPDEPEGQKSIAGSMDVERTQDPAIQAQRQGQERDNIPVIPPELITSESQSMDRVNSHNSQIESSQTKETFTSQSASFICQTSDNSLGKFVEKAWECFEKSAMERLGSATDSGPKTNQENALVENNQGSQTFEHHYTFETIVAPLYHQVFEKMENDKRRMNHASKSESFGKPRDGSLRGVTYPCGETRSSPEISAKHVKDDDYHGARKETFPEYLHNTTRVTENAGPTVETNLASPDVTDSLLDGNVSQSKSVVIQHSTDTQHSWEESVVDQTEQTPEIIIRQSKHSEDIEYSLDNKPPSLQEELISIDSAILPKHTAVDITDTKPSSRSEDTSVMQTPFEEINKMQCMEAQTSEQTLNTCIKCPEESYTPRPDSSLFHCDISANVTPKIIQSAASCGSQDAPRAIQPQIPATIFFSQSLEVTGATVPRVQTTDDANPIRETTNTCQDIDSSHHYGLGVDSLEEMETDAEAIQAERLHSLEETAVGDISQNLIYISQVNNNNEHRISPINLPGEVSQFDGLLVEDMVNMANTNNIKHYEVKENIDVYNHDKNEEQTLADMTENHSGEIKEAGKQSDQKDEEEDDQVEKDKQESAEKTESGNDETFKVESYYTEDDDDDDDDDDDEEVKKDNKQKDEEPRSNRVEWEVEKRPNTKNEEQEIVDGVTVQSVPNIDCFIREVHLYVGQEQQNTNLQLVIEKHSICGEEVTFCGTDVNTDVALGNHVDEDVCQRIDKEHLADIALAEVNEELEKQERNSLNEHSENMDDSASTESLTDDEMDVYLLRLKSTQQSGLMDGLSMGKRHSISRISSPMPPISEYIDEDQPNALLDDLTHEEITDGERVLDKQEDVVESNLLWWREFFSSDNMPKMIAYVLLLVVFIITAYICDFIACFGLYMLALYWLYFQVQKEPLKGT